MNGLHGFNKRRTGVGLVIRYNDSAGKGSIVWMGRDEGNSELGGEFVEFGGLDPVINGRKGSLSNQGGIHFEGRELDRVARSLAGTDLNAMENLVKADFFQ